MTHSLSRTAVLVAAGLALWSAPSLAQSSFGIGPQGGFQKARDADDGDFLVGAMARLKLVPFLGIEGLIGFRREEFAGGDLEVRSWPVQLTGLVYPLGRVLYGAVGAGWYNTTFDFGSDAIGNRTDQEFGWHFGGGLELPLARAVSLTGDVRYVFLNYDFEELPGSGDTNADFYMITLGLLFGLKP